MVVALIAFNFACVDAEEVGRLLNVAECLQAILPHLNGEERRIKELSIADQLCRGADQLDALFPRSRRPCWVGGLCGGNRALRRAAIALSKGSNK